MTTATTVEASASTAMEAATAAVESAATGIAVRDPTTGVSVGNAATGIAAADASCVSVIAAAYVTASTVVTAAIAVPAAITVAAPTAAIAPSTAPTAVIPGAGPDKDAPVEPVRSVVAVRRTGIRIVRIVAPVTDRGTVSIGSRNYIRPDTDSNRDLGVRRYRERYGQEQCQ